MLSQQVRRRHLQLTKQLLRVQLVGRQRGRGLRGQWRSPRVGELVLLLLLLILVLLALVLGVGGGGRGGGGRRHHG